MLWVSYIILILFFQRSTHSNHARCVFQNQSPISLAPTRPRLLHSRYCVLSPICIFEKDLLFYFQSVLAWADVGEARYVCLRCMYGTCFRRNSARSKKNPLDGVPSRGFSKCAELRPELRQNYYYWFLLSRPAPVQNLHTWAQARARACALIG